MREIMKLSLCTTGAILLLVVLFKMTEPRPTLIYPQAIESTTCVTPEGEMTTIATPIEVQP